MQTTTKKTCETPPHVPSHNLGRGILGMSPGVNDAEPLALRLIGRFYFEIEKAEFGLKPMNCPGDKSDSLTLSHLLFNPPMMIP